MTRLRLVTTALLLLCAMYCLAGADLPVHAWEDSLQLPTYLLGPASATPPFGVLTPDAANYPYPLLKKFTKDREERAWRTLNLENEYLLCRVLPDLGGHLYSCRDKRNDREMFYANPVMKFGDVGLRGAWAATGIESNFPVGHSRDTISPVDFAVRSDPDGSGRAVVENIDRVTGMKWRVEYILRPGSTVLEQRVMLSNRSAMRWPYYWWANSGISFDDPATKMILPAYAVSTHTTPPQIIPWPVKADGKDGTVFANHKAAGAWFAYGSREPFFAIYKPAFRSGVAHFADPGMAVGKKIWLWGADGNSNVKRDLTDQFPSYIELQGGRFQNQDMFEFLLPEQSVHFSEFWIPVFDLGGVTRATADAILYFDRNAAKIELSTTHAIQGAGIRVMNDGKAVFETRVDLAPRAAFVKVLDNPSGSPYTIQLRDAAGAILLEHIEGKYDADTADRVKMGVVPEPFPSGPAGETAAGLLARGNYHELRQQWKLAWSDYSIGLQKFPADIKFARAAGNAALNLNRFEDAASLLSRAVAADPSDGASVYGLGLAQAMLGKDADAKRTLSAVPASSPYATAGAFQLALLSARSKDNAGSLATLKKLNSAKAGGIEAALLRRSGNTQEALARLKPLYADDPADSLLRFERILLGEDDSSLWAHLANDGERVLNLVDEYLSIGAYEDALRLLSHEYPPAPGWAAETGAVTTMLHPLIVYYRAFVRAQLGQKAEDDLRKAAGEFKRYVFPNRWSSIAVLNFALKTNPSDVHARLLLGRLLMNQMRVDDAITQWQEGRKINPGFPELDRDLGLVLSEVKKDPAGLLVLKEGLKFNPTNPELLEIASRAGVSAAPSSPVKASTKTLSPPLSPAPVAAPVNAVRGSSPAEIASTAMLEAASGKVGQANAKFDPQVFKADKQPEAVRQAWIEVQLQGLMGMAQAGKCSEAISALFLLGNEDTRLGFTSFGFERYMKLAHFQYYVSTIESDCHKEKSAKKRWSKVSKMTESLPSPEFVFPILAATRLDASSGKVATALETVRAALAKADPGSRAVLAYAEAVLLSASGKAQEAAPRFQEAIKSGDLMIQYLALTAMNQMLGAR